MNKTKYIVYDDSLCAQILIFGPTLQHGDVADQMGVRDRVISAGFLSIGIKDIDELEIGVSAYGRSISLDIDSNPETDTFLARYALGFE